ncbi:UNKNOWN [Stylonychia lemnae]|uniref:Uncharacterized protein n=1 Tax=Stylonychia lemnae TaxID=5949 RepID=A0A077ZVF3_STYLE|nr:UNKNOWN [Stylonychia lemnae]|eukprot:CDW73890.1 UNKNOWN [Stylonychia lemnae]
MIKQGCIIGAYVGDASGGVLEFMKSITKEQVKNALTFPGGGAMGLGKGQITDDSEMAQCILHGILESQREKLDKTLILDLDNITKYYGMWVQEAFDYYNPRPLDVFLNVATNSYNHSLSNGCLMRITPQAVWGSQLSNEDLNLAVELQTNLTHVQQKCIEACQLYCLAIKHLINNPGDAKGAYKLAKSQAKETKNWFESISQQKLPNPKVHIGDAVIAFSYSFDFLKKVIDNKLLTFEQIIQETLLLGGDTDTNAAIVGGLLGAYFGVKNIPNNWIKSMLNFNNFEESGIDEGIERSKFLIPRYNLIDDINTLIRHAPKTLQVKYMGQIYEDLESIKVILPEARQERVASLQVSLKQM